ncbi:MAG: hypothetical protein KatS3mg014_0770 [Actinomycetota bacterium]|nr:MAG: hypothetical protein KatS3mg014_0770 [Actinomycetota bacterium]
MAASPYAERPPAATREKVRILHRGGDLVVACHRTPLPVMDAITVEAVALHPPARITLDLLRGPVPSVTEEFAFEERHARTILTYRGELAPDLWVLGRLYGGRIVRPAWEAVVADSMAAIKARAEERARASERRTGRKQSPSE